MSDNEKESWPPPKVNDEESFNPLRSKIEKDFPYFSSLLKGMDLNGVVKPVSGDSKLTHIALPKTNEDFKEEHPEVKEKVGGPLRWKVNFWSNWPEILDDNDPYNWIEFTWLSLKYEKEFYSLSTGRRLIYVGFLGFNWEFIQVSEDE